MLDIAIQVIKALEILHESGRTHNDLKMENIMVNDGEVLQATLIDFCNSTKYVDKYNNHISKQETQTFSGNIMFASVD